MKRKSNLYNRRYIYELLAGEREEVDAQRYRQRTTGVGRAGQEMEESGQMG